MPSRCWAPSLAVIQKSRSESSRLGLPRTKRRHQSWTNLLLSSKVYNGAPGEDDRGDTERADPMDSVEALDSIIPRSKVQALSRQRSNQQGFLQVARYFGCLIAMAVALRPWPLISTFGLAWVLAFFFCGSHETVHRPDSFSIGHLE